MTTPSSKKTMIWRGGLVAVTGGRDRTRIGTGDALAQVIAESRANEVVRASNAQIGAKPEAQAEAPVASRPPLTEAPSATSGTPSTRIMPIEALFPEGQTQTDASRAPAGSEPVKSTKALWRAHAGRLADMRSILQRDVKRTALYGGAALAILVVALWPQPHEGPSAEQAEAGAAEASEPARAAAVLAPATDTVPMSAGELHVPSAGLERAAVDALASGDLERARMLYLQLAERGPKPSAFSEAARILERAEAREAR